MANYYIYSNVLVYIHESEVTFFISTGSAESYLFDKRKMKMKCGSNKQFLISKIQRKIQNRSRAKTELYKS